MSEPEEAACQNSVTTSSVHSQCLSVVLALKVRRASSQLKHKPFSGTEFELPFRIKVLPSPPSKYT